MQKQKVCYRNLLNFTPYFHYYKNGGTFLNVFYLQYIMYINYTVFKNTDLHSIIIIKPKYKRRIIKKKEKKNITRPMRFLLNCPENNFIKQKI